MLRVGVWGLGLRAWGIHSIGMRKMHVINSIGVTLLQKKPIEGDMGGYWDMDV